MTYIYIFLERLEPQTRQMEDLMTKHNHHYVVEKLIFFISWRNFYIREM